MGEWRPIKMSNLLIQQLLICADCARDSPDGNTYLNPAARPMLKEAASEIERLRTRLGPLGLEPAFAAGTDSPMAA